MNDLINKISTDKLIRYLYVGFLFLIGLLIFDSKEILPIIKDLGSVITSLCFFTIGAFFYTIYRYIIGELFLFWLVHIIHWLIEIRFSEKLNVIAFMRKHKVSFIKSRMYYNNLRENIFNENEQKKFNYAHSEIHMIYLTALVLVFIFITSKFLLNSATATDYVYVILASLVTFTFGIIMDIQQHKIEMRKIKYEIDPEKLKKSFQELGLIFTP